MRLSRITRFAVVVTAAGALMLPTLAARADDGLSDPEAPQGTVLDRVEQAVGWQIYPCSDGEVSSDTVNRPYAGLSGEIVHYGPGPFWETYGDQGYSRIRAARVGDPFPNEPGNIPDLLLEVNLTEGEGPLAGVTNVIRRNSTGGFAQAGDYCEPGATEKWVDYTANYEFYRPAST